MSRVSNALKRQASSLQSYVTAITEDEFRLFQRFMLAEAGVGLAGTKRALVSGRLNRRLRARGCTTFRQYYQLLQEDDAERQHAVDLLTTNETYFFRESSHFELLAEQARAHARTVQPFRVWSAACSSGEEVYSIAMMLAATLGFDTPWEVLGSDINVEVLQRAQRGHYPMTRIDGIPVDYLRRFCLKGKGRQAGTLLVIRELRERTRFRQINLNAPLPRLPQFDAIFLRNVMIYFQPATKQAAIDRLHDRLLPGGQLYIGHSESLNGLRIHDLKRVRGSVYVRKR